MKEKQGIILSLILVVPVIAGIVMQQSSSMQTDLVEKQQQDKVTHIYASWETMEFDKCVAAWKITRFLDEEAKFVFYDKCRNRHVGQDWVRASSFPERG